MSGAAQFPHSRCSVNTQRIHVRSCSVSWLGKVFKSLPGHGRKEEGKESTEVDIVPKRAGSQQVESSGRPEGAVGECHTAAP